MFVGRAATGLRQNVGEKLMQLLVSGIRLAPPAEIILKYTMRYASIVFSDPTLDEALEELGGDLPRSGALSAHARPQGRNACIGPRVAS